MRYQRTLRALIKALKAANVDFAVLGDLERDSGDTARRLGDEATFQALARRNIETLDSIPFRRIVTPDPHVLHSLKNEYRALGGNYTVLHHTTFLASLVHKGRLALKLSGERRRLTYHDPCYLARYNGEMDAPRDLLRMLGLEVSEMERSGLRSRCCGGEGRSAHRHPGQAEDSRHTHRGRTQRRRRSRGGGLPAVHGHARGRGRRPARDPRHCRACRGSARRSAMSEIRRVDPRRPIVITPQGLRRIVLGQVGVGELSTPDPGGAPAGKVKPRRLLGDAKSWVMAVAHSDRGRLDSTRARPLRRPPFWRNGAPASLP